MYTINRHRTLYFSLSTLLIMIVAIPVFYVLAQIIRYPFTETQEVYKLLSDARTLHLLEKSLLLAFTVSVFTTVVSLPLAYVFSNYSFRFKKLIFVLLLLPFFIPPYIYAISWINLCNGNNILQILQLNIFGLWGSAFVLSCWLFPLSFFFFLSSVRLNVRLKEAAQLVGGKIRTFSRITLPLMLPGILAGMIFTFILAITNFSVPGALRLNVFPTEIFIQFGAFFNHQKAIFLSFPLLFISLIFIVLFITKHSGQLKKLEQKSDNSQLKKLSQWQSLVLYLFLTILIFVVLVFPITSLVSGTKSLDVFINTFSDSFSEIWHSVFYNLIATITLTGIGFYLAYFRRKLTSRPPTFLMDVLVLMLISIPGTVFGIVVIRLFQFDGISWLLSSPPVSVVLSDIRYLPVAYFIAIAGLSSLPENYLEAGRLVSHGKFTLFTKIILPLNKNSILGSMISIFVLCFGEIDSAIMIYPPGFETLPLRIYSLLHYGANKMVYALSLLQVLIILLIIVFGFRWINKMPGYHA